MNRSAHLSLALFGALLATVAAVILMLPSNSPAEENPSGEAPSAGQVSEPDPGQQTVTLDDGAEAVSGEILVGYSGSATPQTLPIPESADPAAVAEQVERTTSVRYAIPNYVARLPAGPRMTGESTRAGRDAGAAGVTNSGTSSPVSVSVTVRFLPVSPSPGVE